MTALHAHLVHAFDRALACAAWAVVISGVDLIIWAVTR